MRTIKQITLLVTLALTVPQISAFSVQPAAVRDALSLQISTLRKAITQQVRNIRDNSTVKRSLAVGAGVVAFIVVTAYAISRNHTKNSQPVPRLDLSRLETPTQPSSTDAAGTSAHQSPPSSPGYDADQEISPSSSGSDEGRNTPSPTEQLAASSAETTASGEETGAMSTMLFHTEGTNGITEGFADLNTLPMSPDQQLEVVLKNLHDQDNLIHKSSDPQECRARESFMQNCAYPLLQNGLLKNLENDPKMQAAITRKSTWKHKRNRSPRKTVQQLYLSKIGGILAAREAQLAITTDRDSINERTQEIAWIRQIRQEAAAQLAQDPNSQYPATAFKDLTAELKKKLAARPVEAKS